MPTTHATLTPRSLSKGDATRTQIVSAAARLFGERGFDATGIRDIESAANVSRGTVTYHLGNKEDVWKAAFDHTFLPILDILKSQKTFLLSLEPDVRIRHLTALFIRANARQPFMTQLMIQEGFGQTWRSEHIVHNFLKPVFEVSRELGSDSEAIALAVENPHIRYAMLGACSAVFSLSSEVRALYGQDVFEDAFVDRHIDTIISIVESFVRTQSRDSENTPRT